MRGGPQFSLWWPFGFRSSLSYYRDLLVVHRKEACEAANGSEEKGAEKGAARAIELCVYFSRPLTFVLQGGLTKLEPDENDGEHARIGKNAMLSLCTVPSRNLICPGKLLRHRPALATRTWASPQHPRNLTSVRIFLRQMHP